MIRTIKIFAPALLLPALILGACDRGSGRPLPPAPPPKAGEGPCATARIADHVGRKYEARMDEALRRGSGAASLRVIRPGTAVTMDYRIDRLNVELDDKDRIIALRCG